jgi:hypothetical protein
MTSRQKWNALGASASWVLGALFIVACMEEGPPGEEDRVQTPQVSKGMITASFNRYMETGTDDPFEQFTLTGVFARYSAGDVSTGGKLWDDTLTETDIGLDACTRPSPVLDQVKFQQTRSKSPIELLDVGDLSVTFANLQKPIPTRTFPDLLKVVVGVMYSADDTQGVVFSPGETYDVRAAGTEKVSRFRAVLEAPEDLGEVKINDTVPSEETPVLTRGRSVELTWSGDGYGDEVIATLSWTSMGSPWSITCRMRDDGRFVIPSAITAELPDSLTSSDEVRQVAFRSPDLSSGSFRFIVSTTSPVAF